MNLRKVLFVLLCISVMCIWTTVLIVAVPVKSQLVANNHQHISQDMHVKKTDLKCEKQITERNDDKQTSNSDVLNDVVYQVSNEGTVSVDELLSALDDHNSK